MSGTRFLQDVLGSVFLRESRDADPFDEPEGGDPAAASLFARLGGRDASGPQGVQVPDLPVLCEALLSERGEVSGNRIARAVLARLRDADEALEREFFELLAERLDLDAAEAVRAAERYAAEPTAQRLKALVECVEPRRQELLRRLNRVPGATQELVRLRARLHAHCRVDPMLERVDVDFRHLFRSWFNRGFLVLREIDWSTPANVLEKIIAYEAVHRISSWTALRARLQPSDRRCFAFFHPAMPDEPLIFVEVALTRSNPDTVREVLSAEREILPAESCDTAVFYSISNCQKGLAGISFGNSLIKQVAAELKVALPNLVTFRTLSPVPGFMRWVSAQAAEAVDADGAAVAEPAGALDPLALATRLAAGEGDAPDADGREALARLAARYLVEAKRGDGQPLDPVARFHLGNGASLDRVLPEADVFDKGRRQSAGVMVSYLYDLARVSRHHEAYASRREVVRSNEVAALLAPPRRLRRRA